MNTVAASRYPVSLVSNALPALLAHQPRPHNPAEFLYLPAEHDSELARAS